MFSGNYTAKVDSSGRFSFPAKQLAQIGEERSMYVMLSVVGTSIWLMPKSYWEEFSGFMMKNKFPLGAQENALRRHFIGYSFDTEIETNNRIVIPQVLLDKVEIIDKCTIVGMGEFFELWEPNKFLESEEREEVMRDKAIKELGGTQKL